MKIRIYETDFEGHPLDCSGEYFSGKTALDIVEGMTMNPFQLKVEKFTHGRYYDLHIKRIPFTAIYQYLKEAGWIEYKNGFMPFSHDVKQNLVFKSKPPVQLV